MSPQNHSWVRDAEDQLGMSTEDLDRINALELSAEDSEDVESLNQFVRRPEYILPRDSLESINNRENPEKYEPDYQRLNIYILFMTGVLEGLRGGGNDQEIAQTRGIIQIMLEAVETIATSPRANAEREQRPGAFYYALIRGGIEGRRAAENGQSILTALDQANIDSQEPTEILRNQFILGVLESWTDVHNE
ncbi:hypothetical protein ACO1O0_000196 [Amphichorda felina]